MHFEGIVHASRRNGPNVHRVRSSPWYTDYMPNKPYFRLDALLDFLANSGYTCTRPVITPWEDEWKLNDEGLTSFDFNRHSFLKGGQIPAHNIRVTARRIKTVLNDDEWELHSVEEVR